jgi:DNA polymerase I-like protein with 3'-5' exonuclease and polymerase domains
MIYTIGRVDAPVIVVLTQPNYADIKKGELASGQERDAILSIFESRGISRDDVCITCVYNTDNKIVSTKANADRYVDSWLKPFIKSHKRRLIVPMGNDASYAVGVLKDIAGVNLVRGSNCSSEDYPGVPIFPTINVYFIMQTPDEADDVSIDVRNAVNALRGFDYNLPELDIRDLETPDDVRNMFLEAAEEGICGYDFETDTGEKHIATAVTASFYTGRKNDDGVPIVYFWGAYDLLVPRFSEDHLKKMGKAFKVFFSNAKDNFKLLAWNMGFDDAVAQHNYFDDEEWEGSDEDGMLYEWGVDNRTYNGLKEAAFRRLGYPNYDGPVDEHVKAISARRGKNLVHPDDFRTLERFGQEAQVEILKSGKEKLTWPKTLDKKTAAWALVPYDDLRLYNAYDAYFTVEVIKVLKPLVKKYKLENSQKLRHRIAKMFMKSELRGFQCDVKANREISAELGELIESSKNLCLKELDELFEDIRVLELNVSDGKFVLNSGDNLAKILYGKPTAMPAIVPVNERVSKKHKAIIADFNAEFYSQTEKVKALVDSGAMDITAIDAKIKHAFNVVHGDAGIPYTTSMQDQYLHGFYVPKLFTKNGKPSVTAGVLNNLYAEKPMELLKYILMYRRAYKLKSTFVDSIYNKLDADGILRYRLNAIGTNTGRVSSCVQLGTVVNTIDGAKNIEDLKIGDMVLGHDGLYHACESDAYTKPQAMFYRVINANGDSIVCTESHRFYTERGWKDCNQLVPGSTLLYTYKNGEFSLVEVDRIEKEYVGIPWDVAVEGCHSYVAQGFVNHNSKPNCQNFVKYIRGQMIPREGYEFVEFDLSQAEIRAIAAFSGDKRLIAALYEKDMHRYIASLIFKKPMEEVTDYERKASKAQPLTSNILTPNGWVKMGDLSEGDYVIGSNGGATRVMGIFPQGEKQVYKVNVGGHVVECSEDHWWTVFDRKYRKDVLMTTKEIQDAGLKFNKTNRFAIKTVDPVKFTKTQLPLHPYVLGVMLGDGHFTDSSFSTNDVEIAERVRELLGCEYEVRLLPKDVPNKVDSYRITQAFKGAKSGKALNAILRNLGFNHNSKSHEKFIPDMYKYASLEDRMWLLRGLMDTDGTCDASKPQATYTTVSDRFRDDVMELVRSLGGTTSSHSEYGSYIDKDGNKVQGRLAHRVRVTVPNDPFSLDRKSSRWNIKKYHDKTFMQPILGIESTDDYVPMQCIRVDSPDSLYVTDGYVLTHNTIIFGILYGLSHISLAVAINCSEEEAQDFIEFFYAAFPDVKIWLDKQIELAKVAPYKARTPWGTMRSTKNIFSVSKKEIKHMENVSQNMPIQGAAGELTLYYICEIMDEVKRQGWDVHMINTTHDSCTLEVPIGLSERVIELVEKVVAAPAPVAPLDTVVFKADIEVSMFWSCEPNVRKAIDPKYDTPDSTFPWDIVLGIDDTEPVTV